MTKHFILSGCEDWKIRLWKIPKDGLTETIEEPHHILLGKKAIRQFNKNVHY